MQLANKRGHHPVVHRDDFNDAGAIAQAGTRARMRCVPLKTHGQLEVPAQIRVRPPDERLRRLNHSSSRASAGSHACHRSERDAAGAIACQDV